MDSMDVVSCSQIRAGIKEVPTSTELMTCYRVYFVYITYMRDRQKSAVN